MRLFLMAAGAAMLAGCATPTHMSDYAIREDGSRAPSRKDMKREPVRKRDSKVERWTREQRHCEAGDRDDQRRCVMPYPGS